MHSIITRTLERDHATWLANALEGDTADVIEDGMRQVCEDELLQPPDDGATWKDVAEYEARCREFEEFNWRRAAERVVEEAEKLAVSTGHTVDGSGGESVTGVEQLASSPGS